MLSSWSKAFKRRSFHIHGPGKRIPGIQLVYTLSFKGVLKCGFNY